MTSIPWLSAVGVILDIVGAAWIAKALAFSSTQDLMDQATTRWDTSQTIVRALEHERLDTRCGLSVLICGFVMQLAGLFLPNCPVWAAALLGAIALMVA